MTRQRFRYPRDALALTRLALGAVPSTAPKELRDVVGLMGAAIGDRDRALEDWLQLLGASVLFDAIIDPTNGSPTNNAIGAYDDPANHAYLTVGSALTNEALFNPNQTFFNFAVRSTSVTITEAADTTLGGALNLAAVGLWAMSRDFANVEPVGLNSRPVWNLNGSKFNFGVQGLYCKGLYIQNLGTQMPSLFTGATSNKVVLDDCVIDCSDSATRTTLTITALSGGNPTWCFTGCGLVDLTLSVGTGRLFLFDTHYMSNVAAADVIDGDCLWDGGSHVVQSGGGG